MVLRNNDGAAAKVRVQLDLRPDEARALDELRDRAGLRSRADAVRFSLGVIGWIADQIESERQILAVGERDAVYLAIPGVTTSIRQRRRTEVS